LYPLIVFYVFIGGRELPTTVQLLQDNIPLQCYRLCSQRHAD